MRSSPAAPRVLQFVFILGAMTALGFTPALEHEPTRAVCQGGATADSAWCCACNEEYCGPVEHSGLWECDGAGACESPPCAILE